MIKRFVSPLMKFAKSSPLYSLRCSAYSYSHQGCWAALKSVNNKKFNGVVMIFSFKVTLFFIFIFTFNL